MRCRRSDFYQTLKKLNSIEWNVREADCCRRWNEIDLLDENVN